MQQIPYNLKMINKIEKWEAKAKRLFRERRIYHKEIAELLGLKKASISQKLNGNIGTEVSEMILIAKRLDMTIDQLVIDDPKFEGSQSNSVQFMKEYGSLSEVQQELVLKVMRSIQDETTT
tara:strand:+ start:1466 stop:1828 length:363 start_codon:yes stop_codon:yes gene_type:complete